MCAVREGGGGESTRGVNCPLDQPVAQRRKSGRAALDRKRSRRKFREHSSGPTCHDDTTGSGWTSHNAQTSQCQTTKRPRSVTPHCTVLPEPTRSTSPTSHHHPYITRSHCVSGAARFAVRCPATRVCTDERPRVSLSNTPIPLPTVPAHTRTRAHAHTRTRAFSHTPTTHTTLFKKLPRALCLSLTHYHTIRTHSHTRTLTPYPIRKLRPPSPQKPHLLSTGKHHVPSFRQQQGSAPPVAPG